MAADLARKSAPSSPVILVTDGGSGIGFGIARKFAAMGYDVAIASADRERCKRVLVSLEKYECRRALIAADLRNEKQVQTLLRRTIDQFGRLDVLCNNADIRKLGAMDRVSTSLWDEAMAVNVRGAYLCMKYALPHLKFSKGAIVNIASIAGLVGYAEGSAYCSSKAALIMLSKTTARELAPYGIRVNCICPGATHSPMIAADKIKEPLQEIPLGRVVEPNDVAELALFLASDKASHITGGVYVIDGGVTAGRV
ncbi:MAG: SDR family oxidoreductase [Deltaproteobacteria bacterium]|nr:SDR family oxidoreductase [Deltaproteobacteria bacterium]